MKTIQLLFGHSIFSLLLISCGSSKQKTEQDTKTIEARSEYTGNFRSIKGVKDFLSCYCYNAGYLTLENGSTVKVCFEDSDLDIYCDKLKVVGKFETHIVKQDPMSPCPAGEEEILIAESYECLD